MPTKARRFRMRKRLPPIRNGFDRNIPTLPIACSNYTPRANGRRGRTANKRIVRDSLFAWGPSVPRDCTPKTVIQPICIISIIPNRFSGVTYDGNRHRRWARHVPQLGISLSVRYAGRIDPETGPIPFDQIALSDHAIHWVAYAYSGGFNASGLARWPSFSETAETYHVSQETRRPGPVPNLDRLGCSTPCHRRLAASEGGQRRVSKSRPRTMPRNGFDRVGRRTTPACLARQK